MLLGKEAMQKLYCARVAVFGVGGVGSYAVEALARSGVGAFMLIDPDEVCLSNLNRQLIATHDTVGRKKAEVAKERILSINPQAQVEVRPVFYLPENAGQFDLSGFSYIIDAVDTVCAKLEIISRAYQAGVLVISSMGAGNKLDPTRFCVADIYETSVCPLAKVMRRELKKRGIPALKVVYSAEQPVVPLDAVQQATHGSKRTPGSVAFVPSVAGLIMAGEVIKDIVDQ